MKELSVEEKAKAYDRALAKAKEQAIDGFLDAVAVNDIFPSLKENEDERIRKSLITLLQHFCKGYRIPGLDFPVSYKDMLAWLKKQGEK